MVKTNKEKLADLDFQINGFKEALNGDGSKEAREWAEGNLKKLEQMRDKLKSLPLVTIDDVLGRMYNWKMNSAFEYAKQVKDFPEDALSILKELSENFGNCGWQDGKIYNQLREKNHQVAEILGYIWSEEKDNWIKK